LGIDCSDFIGALYKPRGSKIEIVVSFNKVCTVLNRRKDTTIERLNDLCISQVEFIASLYIGSDTKLGVPEKRNFENFIWTKNDAKEKLILSFNDLSRISWFYEPYHQGKTFISYPGYEQTEDAYINSFIKRIQDDLVVIDDDQKSYININYSHPEFFEKIDDNYCMMRNTNNVQIFIDNIPEKKHVFFNTSILKFKTRTEDYFLNLSEKFRLIVGTFNRAYNKIVFSDIKHNLSLFNVVIPTEIWNDQGGKNDSGCDNRSYASKTQDYFINDCFLGGINEVNDIFNIDYTINIGGNTFWKSNNNELTKIANNNLQMSEVNNNVINNLSFREKYAYLESCGLKHIPKQDIRSVSLSTKIHHECSFMSDYFPNWVTLIIVENKIISYNRNSNSIELS
jgi:hypothetical protein